jgi:hypothetical protein
MAVQTQKDACAINMVSPSPVSVPPDLAASGYSQIRTALELMRERERALQLHLDILVLHSMATLELHSIEEDILPGCLSS